MEFFNKIKRLPDGIHEGALSGGQAEPEEPPESEPFQLDQVEQGLHAGCLGLPLWYFESIDSTNLEGRRRAVQGAPHGSCLVADFQTAGRGRLERTWIAPPRSCLLFSVILRPDLNLNMVFGLTNLMALAICKSIEKLCGLKPGIKWPNDIYLDNKKLVGILTEFTARKDKVDFAVVGAGLNVNLGAHELGRVASPAASLRCATNLTWSREQILAEILRQLDALYRRYMETEPDVLVTEYNRRSITIGQRITVQDGDRIRTGRAQAVSEDGALVMLENSGKRTIIRCGDVTVLKT